MIGYIIMGLIFLSSLAISSSHAADQAENLRPFTAQELKAFDGKDGRSAYTAYEGLIYDVTESLSWPDGEHYGHMAGVDLSSAMAGAPHDASVLDRFPVVGRLAVDGSEGAGGAPQPKRLSLLLWGKTLTAWSGYLFGLIFIFNFMSCYVMPWCARSVPWKGKIPGPDRWDKSIVKLSYYHRYFAWLTIILGIIHGVLGIFQSFGIRI